MQLMLRAVPLSLACVAYLPVLTHGLSTRRQQLGGESPPERYNGPFHFRPTDPPAPLQAQPTEPPYAEVYHPEPETCGDLVNQGAYWTIGVTVGTPYPGTAAQNFDLIADTGSDSTIVTSCLCIDFGLCHAKSDCSTLARGACERAASCFKGYQRSSSFKLEGVASGNMLDGNKSDDPIGVELVYGSGALVGIITTDYVEVAGKWANMPKGLLLTVDQRALPMSTEFDGILGLGRPVDETDEHRPAGWGSHPLPDTSHWRAENGWEHDPDRKNWRAENGWEHDPDRKHMRPWHQAEHAVIKKEQQVEEATAIRNRTEYSDESPPVYKPPRNQNQLPPLIKAPGGASPIMHMQQMLNKSGLNKSDNSSLGNRSLGVYKPKLFMGEAGVKSFSLCFNDGGNFGSLRTNVPAFTRPLPAMGTFHWGIGLYGVAIGPPSYVGGRYDDDTHVGGHHDHGARTLPPVLCSESDMKKGQLSPCGAIPDSGTTLIMAPREQIEKLYVNICSNWDRCRVRSRGMPDHLKANIFLSILRNCSDWIEEEANIDEMPSLYLTVGGPGHKQILELSPWAYVVVTHVPKYTIEEGDSYAYGPIPIPKTQTTVTYEQQCTTAIDSFHYPTTANGPVWILGHPLFYQFTVGYNTDQHLEGARYKGTMSFTKQTCNDCRHTQTSQQAPQKWGASGETADTRETSQGPGKYPDASRISDGWNRSPGHFAGDPIDDTRQNSNEPQYSLLSSESKLESAKSKKVKTFERLRKLNAPARRPSIDTSVPLVPDETFI